MDHDSSPDSLKESSMEPIEKDRPSKNIKSKDKKEKENVDKEYVICKYSLDHTHGLYEAILIGHIPYFMSIQNEKISIHQRIELDDLALIPPNKTSYLSKDYSFSSMEEISIYHKRAKKENLDSIYKKVKNVWRKYLDVDEDSLILCAADTVFTYYQDKMGMTHYLLFVGDNNSGKSNALRIFDNLGYRPMFDTSITPANIYNFLDKIEEGQGIILEDEIDNIDEQPEKMRIYKGGYVSGTQVTRIYDTSSNSKSAKRQQRYFTYSFKAFSSEKQPTFYKAKGFNERLLTINCSPGNPQYDITETINDAGDSKYKKLNNELIDLRKLLLIFRMVNYDNPLPDIEITLRNRDKQLCKPILRLFQNTNCLNEIANSLSKFISEKKRKKLNSLDSYLYSIILDLTRKESNIISNEILWEFICQLPGDKIPNKPLSYQTEEFGLISKSQITKICEDKFGAHRHHDGGKRYLIFNSNTLRNLESNYSLTSESVVKFTNFRTNTINTVNAFWNRLERNSLSIRDLQTNRVEEIRLKPINEEEKSTENSKIDDNSSALVIDNIDKNSSKVLVPLGVLEHQKEIENKIKERGLYRKWLGSDTWACPNCNDSDNKFYMVDHICRMNKKK